MDTPETAPVAYMRKWSFDGDEGTRGNRPRGWTRHAVTKTKLLDDDIPLYARHRTRATRQDGLREAIDAFGALLATHDEDEGMDDFGDDESVGVQSDADGTNVRDLPLTFGILRRARKAFAALSDSSTREKSGSDEALKEQEFNRGVLIAVSTLINCWGRGTETEHLLAMINATPEMVEQMGFDNYDREPLLAALSASPEGEG